MAEIPALELAALRAAFEKTMRAMPFDWVRFEQMPDGGYLNHNVQAAWFACRCGWLAGNSYSATKEAP
jgi:hypothetical protein